MLTKSLFDVITAETIKYNELEDWKRTSPLNETEKAHWTDYIARCIRWHGNKYSECSGSTIRLYNDLYSHEELFSGDKINSQRVFAFASWCAENGCYVLRCCHSALEVITPLMIEQINSMGYKVKLLDNVYITITRE